MLQSNRNLHRNVVESNIQYLSFKCSGVKVISLKKNTQVNYRYSKNVLKYSTQVNALHYCPPLVFSDISGNSTNNDLMKKLSTWRYSKHV